MISGQLNDQWLMFDLALLRRVAREVMESGGFGYYLGGATDEWTLKDQWTSVDIELPRTGTG